MKPIQLKKGPYHMGSQQFKQEDDQARRQKKIDKAMVALEELSPKLTHII